MSPRAIWHRATRVWLNWASFKLGVFVGVLIGFVVMAVLLTVPRIALSILGGIQ